MYAMLGTRPDIAFAITTLSQFSSNPGPKHWMAIKRLLRYLRGTLNYSLTYGELADNMSTSIKLMAIVILIGAPTLMIVVLSLAMYFCSLVVLLAGKLRNNQQLLYHQLKLNIWHPLKQLKKQFGCALFLNELSINTYPHQLNLL